MGKTANKPGALFLVEYTGIIDEVNLNWGFKGGYFEEEKIPVLFIFSNFPHTKKTNRQSLLGSIRMHVEEQKGIIFFPNVMNEELMQFVHEALKKEKVDLDFHLYSDEKYNPAYLAQICDICFSIKNINLKEILKSTSAPAVGEILALGKSTIHHNMIENLAKGKDEEVSAFTIDKTEKSIVESLHLDQKPSPKREASFQNIVKDKAFKSLFFDLFLGENSVPERIKRFYGGKGWKFDSLLIFYSGRKKRVFIQDLPESALFLNSNEMNFINLNTTYNLLKFDYETKPEQKITITLNYLTLRYDVLVDDKAVDSKDIIRDIMMTFPCCTESVNEFLNMITHSIPNEYRIYFDRMAVFVKTTGNRYTIENYEARQNFNHQGG